MDKDLEKVKKWLIIGIVGMVLLIVGSFVRGFLHDSIVSIILGVVGVVICIKMLINLRRLGKLDELGDEDFTDDDD